MVPAVSATGTATGLALLLLLGCGGGEHGRTGRTVTPLDHSTTGTITGTVSLQGVPPPMAMLPIGSEPVCSAQHTGPVPAGDALVHDGRVENAFVYIKEGLENRTFAIPDSVVTIDQRGCLYHPHVVGAQVGQAITFVNSDELLHNVHGSPHESPPWNFGMSVQGSRRTIRVDKPEVMIDLRCDVHPWMHAYLGVLDHPYFAVTGPEGRFIFTDVPPGDYVIAAWHERFGTREARLTLGPKETRDVSFTYSAKP
jgi:plastocyanin